MTASDPKIVIAFREAILTDKAERVRLRVANLAKDMRLAQLQTLVPTLGEVMQNDKDPAVRLAALEAVMKAGDKGKTIINIVVALFKDSDTAIRANSAELIGRIGPEAKAAIPGLILLLKDSEASVRLAATFSLGRVGSDGLLAINELCQLLGNDSDIPVRKEAARAFALLGSPAKAAIPVLGKAIREDKSEEVRQAALIALGKFGADVKLVVADVLEVMKNDKDKNVRAYAVHTLGNSLGGGLKDYVKELATQLSKDPEGEVRLAIVQELGALGPDAKDALPQLGVASSDVQLAVRDAAKAAVKRINAKPEEPKKN